MEDKDIFKKDYEEMAGHKMTIPKIVMSFEEAWDLSEGLEGEERRQKMRTLAMSDAQDKYEKA